MKNARRKLEIPMPAAMPCKTPVNCRGESCRSIGIHKTKYACIDDADESMRTSMEGSHHNNHEDHIEGKIGEFIESLQSCSKVHSDA